MNQNTLRRILGFILLVCLAIGLIIFAALTAEKSDSDDSAKSLDFLENAVRRKINLDDEIEDHVGQILNDPLSFDPIAIRQRPTTTTITTTTEVTTTTAADYIILLNNDTKDASGKVYIEYGGRRGFVCNDGFDDNDAAVVCREKGYKKGFSYNLLISPGYEQYTRDEPILSNLLCHGNESHLYQCPDFSLDVNVTDSCTGFATVLCYDDIPYKFRFVNSLASDSGQIEMFVDGKWGTFCAIQNFDQTIAETVCKKMNYTGGIPLPRGTGGPATTTQVWVPWISCYNNRTPKTIFDCELVLHTKNIPFDYHTHWNNRYRGMYHACIDTKYPFAPAVHCYMT